MLTHTFDNFSPKETLMLRVWKYRSHYCCRVPDYNLQHSRRLFTACDRSAQCLIITPIGTVTSHPSSVSFLLVGRSTVPHGTTPLTLNMRHGHGLYSSVCEN